MPSLLRRGAQSVLHFLLKRVALKLVAIPVRRRLAHFEAATCHPRQVQEAVLGDILAAQSATAFGRDHHFHTARTVEDYRRQVPVAGYDAIEPYLARVRRGETTALLAETHVYMFALTSGTTATRKTIPVTARYLADYKRGWNLWGLMAFRDHDQVRMRPIVQISGDHDECRTESNVPCGAVTGLTATMQKRIIRWLYCVPACVGKIKDPAAKYYTILRLGLPRSVGMIVAANPSTLINLAQAGDREKATLIQDIADGTLSPRFDLPGEVRATLQHRVGKPNRQRAAQLEAIVARTGTLYPRDYWPGTFLLGNWTGGSVGAYLRHYPRYFGDNPVRDVGLIASEGRMTIPFADNTPSGVLDITSHYFEFIPEEEGDSPNPTVLGAHELREGGRYFILLTTGYGLYRYHIYDLVRVTGFHNQTPLLEFLSKGAHIASITGEKLSEYQVTQAMAEVLRELDVTLTTYSVAPCWPEEGEFAQPYYGLFVERGDLKEGALRLAGRLDERLREINVEYDSKRARLRLGPIRLEVLPAGFWARWDRERLRQTGGALEQYKHPCLIANTKFAGEVRAQVETWPCAG